MYLSSLGRGTRVLILSLAVIFGSAGLVQAASTISTNIFTGGTLGALGVSTFGATASTTISAAGVVTLPSGDTIKNTSASTTAVSGTLTADANLTLLNAQAATSTVTAACIITTATSSATKIRLMFNTSATTTTINGGVVQGVVVWGYGSSCP